MERKLKLGELFAGYGGLGLAVEAAFDAEISWVSEWDPNPSKILAYRFPGVPNYGDITQIDWASIEQVDIISGGFPCQDLSLAGKRRGMREGTRSGLWAHMFKGIEIQRPRFVVAENVRGLLSGEAFSDVEQCAWCMGDDKAEPDLRALGAVLADLAGIGYDAQWIGLRAADVGAPHNRFRVFVLAHDTRAPEDPDSFRSRWRGYVAPDGEGAWEYLAAVGTDDRDDESGAASTAGIVADPGGFGHEGRPGPGGREGARESGHAGRPGSGSDADSVSGGRDGRTRDAVGTPGGGTASAGSGARGHDGVTRDPATGRWTSLAQSERLQERRISAPGQEAAGESSGESAGRDGTRAAGPSDAPDADQGNDHSGGRTQAQPRGSHGGTTASDPGDGDHADPGRGTSASDQEQPWTGIDPGPAGHAEGDVDEVPGQPGGSAPADAGDDGRREPGYPESDGHAGQPGPGLHPGVPEHAPGEMAGAVETASDPGRELRPEDQGELRERGPSDQSAQRRGPDSGRDRDGREAPSDDEGSDGGIEEFEHIRPAGGVESGERGGLDWGPYKQAIERWERVTGRPVPRPTEPSGRNGSERLSARFTEWMMGLPDGWLTDPDIWVGMSETAARNAQLKACGNGVVPQQSYAALMLLLDVVFTEGEA